MSKEKSLSAKQLTVIEDLFEGEQEQKILEKHKLSRKLYNNWLADKVFNDQLDWRVAWEYRRSEFILARKAREAVSNLIKLTECQNPETARKACLDIITMRANLSTGTPTTPSENRTLLASDIPELTLENAGKVLAVLAEGKKA
jgi:hypothetical protein